MKSHHNYVHVWYLFSLLRLFGKKIANFSKRSSGLVSLVIGAYWNPDLWDFELTSVDLVDGAKVSQPLFPPPPPQLGPWLNFCLAPKQFC